MKSLGENANAEPMLQNAEAATSAQNNRSKKRKTMKRTLTTLIAAAFVALGAPAFAGAIVITGAGDKAFCAGADLGLMIPLMSGAREPENEYDEAMLTDKTLLQTALLRDFEMYKPVIAAVNGFAVAGGMEILQATDIRVAVTSSEFGLAEVTRGIIPAGGSLVRLARQIPFCKAMEVLLVGDRMSADEALRIGLINEVVPADQLMDRVKQIGERIAENGPLAVAACKEAVIRTSGLPLQDAFAIENSIAGKVMRTKDAREGPLAFMEKRKPEFKGE